MAIDAEHVEVRQRGGQPVHAQGFLVRDAELVLAQAGGDVGVGARVDVGVHAQRDRRPPSERTGDLVQPPQLALRFDVEAAHADLERALHLRARLADAGEHDPRGVAAGGQHPFELAARHDVEARAAPGEQVDDRQVGVRLQRVADEHLAAGRRTREFVEGRGDGRLRIDPGGRAEALGDVGKRDVFGQQPMLAVVEGFHGDGVRIEERGGAARRRGPVRDRATAKDASWAAAGRAGRAARAARSRRAMSRPRARPGSRSAAGEPEKDALDSRSPRRQSSMGQGPSFRAPNAATCGV